MKPELGHHGAETDGEASPLTAESRPNTAPIALDLPLVRNASGLRLPADSTNQPNAARPPRDIYQEMLKALRGRYRLTAVLAIVGAALGAATAYLVKAPLYKSEGLLRIAYSMPPVLQETDQNRPMAMFASYLSTQIQILKSRKILEPALKQPAWQKVGGESSEAAIRQFVTNLAVEHPDDTDQLRISYTDEDPNIAAAAVNAVVGAYREFYQARDETRLRDELRLKTLRDERDKLQQSLESSQQQLVDLVRKFGSTDLDARSISVEQRLNMLLSELSEARLAMAIIGVRSGEQQTGPGATTAPSAPANALDLSPERIARTDAKMRQLLEQKAQLEDAITELRTRFGYGPSHREVQDKSRQLDILNRRIDQYAADYRLLQSELVSRVDAMRNTPGVALDAQHGEAEVKLRQAALDEMYRQTTDEAALLATGKLQISHLKGEVQKLETRLDEYDQRIRSLQMESGPEGRLSVVSSGEVPVRAFYDPRKKYVLAGAAAGAALPVAALIAIGLLSRKYRWSYETEDDVAHSTPLLGILPTLEVRTLDVTQAADAAHSVHQIRAALQNKRSGGPHSEQEQQPQQGVYMITSACSGEGKTNITVALGLSFAASGYKTVMIDCDLVGRGLTRGYNANGIPGLREALHSGSARGIVKKTDHGPRLIAAGNADSYSGWTLSQGAMAGLIAEARRYYDVVIIDTGPVLGSVEAAIVAPEVDGVIVAISRGQQRTLVERALRQLGSIGAKPVGFIFNRARPRDFEYSAMHSSARMASVAGSATDDVTNPPLGDSEHSEVAAFGPLVRSVARFLRPLNASALPS